MEHNDPRPKSSTPSPCLGRKTSAPSARGKVVDVAAFKQGLGQSPVKPSWQEKIAASRKIGDFVYQTRVGTTTQPPTKEEIGRIAKLVKITGRRERVFGGPHCESMGTAGHILDSMVLSHQKTLAEGGDLPPFTSAAPTTIAMAKKLALYTGGAYEWRHPTTWITSHGWKHRDPSDHVEYPSRAGLENAWGMLSSLGEGITYRDQLGSERQALKFGKYIFERASKTVIGAIGAHPQSSRFLLSVRTVASLNKLQVRP